LLGRIQAPDGFEKTEMAGRVLLLSRDGLGAPAREILLRPETWSGLEAGDPTGSASGRGTTRRVDLGEGRRAVVKKMRRGGIAARVWRDRFAGTDRLLANLTVPTRASDRGVPTARPLALVLREGPAGLFEAWMATEEIAGAEDLLARLRREPAPTDDEQRAVLETLRHAHDVGLDHPDLNLGNVLVDSGRGESPWSVHLIDLDRATITDGALPFSARQRCLRRLERSYVKKFGPAGPLGPDGTDRWYDLYAGDDTVLRDRLRAGRRTGRRLLGLHRLGWRLSGRGRP
jgi:hypothetical protein